jgi:hypothetical protein
MVDFKISDFVLLRPLILDVSIDAEPLITSLTDLVFHFPYHRLQPVIPSIQSSTIDNNNHPLPVLSSILSSFTSVDRFLLHWLMRPEVVLGILFFYIFLSKSLVKIARHVLQLSTSRTSNIVLRLLVALHNLLLALFSGWVAFHSWNIVIRHYVRYGFLATYCDPHRTLWLSSDSTNQNEQPIYGGLGTWCILFYWSKYYEFIDSWILVLKGKAVSFLQVYHHTGIVFVMWGGILCQASWLQYVILFNSVIHTFMYTYYFIKTISPKLEIRGAKYLTAAQILQFITGISCTLGVFALSDLCATLSSRFFLACLHGYGIGLIVLFLSFAQQKYQLRSNNTGSKME